MLNNVRIIPFFNSVKEKVSKAGISGSVYNGGYSLLTLELAGDGSLSCTTEGAINTIDGDSTDLKEDEMTWNAVLMFDSSFNKVDSITGAGIYYVVVKGMSRIRLNISKISGSFQIVGSLGE
jgi:hypothetical protein